jgi:hypothetical protein
VFKDKGSAYCHICFRESSFFDELVDSKLEEGSKEDLLLKSFVFSTEDNFCCHAACLNLSVNDVDEVRERIKLANGDMAHKSIFVFKSNLWNRPNITDKECYFCNQPGLLLATLLNTEEKTEHHAHLICALYSNRTRMQIPSNFVFDVKSAPKDLISLQCLYCQTKLGSESVCCTEATCQTGAHLYCILSNRIERLKEQKEKKRSGIQDKFDPFDSKYWYIKPKWSRLRFDNFGDDRFNNTPEVFKLAPIEKEILHLCDDHNPIEKVLAKMHQMLLQTDAGPQRGGGREEPSTIGDNSLNFLNGNLCPEHQKNCAYYCNCGQALEVTNPDSYESTMCDDCGVWFHNDCVTARKSRWALAVPTSKTTTPLSAPSAESCPFSPRSEKLSNFYPLRGAASERIFGNLGCCIATT